MRIRDCGCTYRAVAQLYVSEQEATDIAAKLLPVMLGSQGATWGECCTAVRANTDARRDALHHVLHLIAIPEVTPERGPGRRGTKWYLRQNG